MDTKIFEKVYGFIDRYHMIERGDRIIAGVSGGADSICLLFLLLEVRKEREIEVIAVHVNHGIRGESAYRDEEFVRSICKAQQVPCEIYRENVESIARKRKQSVEEAGRFVRREAFEDALARYGGTKIALAHHQNDNAETLLMNLARGAGLNGLGGIRPINGNVIRPLLGLNRREIEECVEELGCGFCRDETNEEDIYTRNRLRHQVIPVLEEQVNAQAVLHMNEAMAQVREAQEYIGEQVRKAYEQCVEELWEMAQTGYNKENVTAGCGESVEGESGSAKTQREDIFLIKKAGWEREHRMIQNALIRKCLIAAAGAEQNLSMVHVEAVRDLFGKQVGRSLDLPYGVKARRCYEGVELKKARYVGRKTKQSIENGVRFAVHRHGEMRPKSDFSQRELFIPGAVHLREPGIVVTCKIFEKPENFSEKDIPQKNYTKWFDYDIIKSTLVVRTRQVGDSIVIDRSGRRQKLKAWFINEKIPAEEREHLPLIAEDSEILWIIGHRMSGKYQITGQTKNILEISVMSEPPETEKAE